MRGQENVSAIAAIQHSLRDIDPRSRKVRFIVDVSDSIDWSTVNPHPQPNMRMTSQGSADFQSAPYRFLGTAKKKQRHPISRRHSTELAVRFRRPKTFGLSHDLI